MSSFHWEDPFGRNTTSAHEPVLWIPNRPIPPVDLKDIRQQQAELLPLIDQLQSLADNVLRRIEADPRMGGPLFLQKIRRIVAIEVLYRNPDRPNLVSHPFAEDITDAPVILPANSRPPSSVLDQLLRIQRVPDMAIDREPAFAAAQQELGFVKHVGVAPESLSPDRIVVYPKFLGFVAMWIKKIDSPILDVRFEETVRNPISSRRETPFDEPGDPHHPAPPAGVPPSAQFH